MDSTHELPEPDRARVLPEAEDALDPREAAAILVRTSREATRRLDGHPAVLSALSAVVVLVVYGTLWLSVRGQHPYRGPSLGVVGVVYIVVAVGVFAAVATYLRAAAGVSGRSRRESRVLAIPAVVAVLGFYTFLGALQHDGFGPAVVYGVVDAAGPWIVVGALLGGHAAAQEDRWKLTGSVAMMVVGAGAAFAGPSDVWGILAVAGCLLLLAQGALRLTSARGQ